MNDMLYLLLQCKKKPALAGNEITVLSRGERVAYIYVVMC